MISRSARTFAFLVTVFFVLCMTDVKADYVEFFEQLRLEEMYHVLGPEEVLLSFTNKTNQKLIFNEACRRDVLSYKSALDKKEIWAIRMMDSSSKTPSGLLIGNVNAMGMYDECMEVYINKSNTEIIGNHCTYTLYLSYNNKTLGVNPQLSICLPLSCQEKDLDNILRQKIEDVGGYEAYNFTEFQVYCSDQHTRDPTGAIITSTVIGAIFLFLVICSILNWLKNNQYTDIEIPRIFSEISLFKNTAEIFSLKDSPGSISALHGLRFFSTSFIILGHGILLRAAGLHANNIHVAHLPTWQAIVIVLVVNSVDTFLTISGFLASYSFLEKHMNGKKKFRIGQYYLHRYIRLMPAIATTVLVSIYIFPFIGSGPNWRQAINKVTSDVCRKKLWTIFLFVNNFFHKKAYCLPHLWSTAVDMQLFWISPLILYPLAKRPKLGLWICGFLIIMSMITSAVITAVNNYPFTFNAREASFNLILDMFDNLYTPFYTRAGSWLIGIILGYIVITGPKELEKSTVVAGWATSISLILYCFVGFWHLLQKDYEYEVAYEAMFGSLCRVLWSASIAWIIFACIRGYGGFVEKFLSSPIFFPLSRLSFCTYLVHIPVQIANSQVARTPTYFILFQQVIAFFTDLIISLTVAYFLCIVFEIPTRTLEKFMFRKEAVVQEPKKEVTELIKED